MCVQACERPVHRLVNTTFRKHHFAEVVLRKCNSANTDFQNHHSGNRCLRIPLCTGRFPDQIPRLFGLCTQACDRPVHSCADRCFRKHHFPEVVFAELHFRKHGVPRSTCFARTVPEPGQAVSADMLVSVRLHESCIGGFGYPHTPVPAV